MWRSSGYKTWTWLFSPCISQFFFQATYVPWFWPWRPVSESFYDDFLVLRMKPKVSSYLLYKCCTTGLHPQTSKPSFGNYTGVCGQRKNPRTVEATKVSIWSLGCFYHTFASRSCRRWSPGCYPRWIFNLAIIFLRTQSRLDYVNFFLNTHYVQKNDHVSVLRCAWYNL